MRGNLQGNFQYETVQGETSLGAILMTKRTHVDWQDLNQVNWVKLNDLYIVDIVYQICQYVPKLSNLLEYVFIIFFARQTFPSYSFTKSGQSDYVFENSVNTWVKRGPKL